MRAILVKSNEPVALLFHDYKSGVSYCRSKVESFLKVFDLEKRKNTCIFKRDNGGIKASGLSLSDYDWLDVVVESIGDKYYEFEELDSVPDIESTIDRVVEEYL